jgi:hypothetical protein
MVAAGRLVGRARAATASQPGSDGGRTDEQEKITPLDRHPDTLPRVRRAWDPASGDQRRLSNACSVRPFGSRRDLHSENRGPFFAAELDRPLGALGSGRA